MRLFQLDNVSHLIIHSFLSVSSLDPGKDLPDASLHQKIRSRILWCDGLIDHHQLFSIVIVDQTGCRIDHKRSAAHDQNIGIGNIADRFGDHLHIQPLLIKDHIRLDETAAGTVRHTFRLPHIFRIKKFAAARTVISVDAAVELQYLFAPGFLVQTIDILGDDCLQAALLLPLGQFPVSRIGFGIQDQHLVFIEPVKFLRIFHEKGMTQNGFRRIGIFLVIQSVLTSEIGDPAFCRNTRTSEKYNVFTAFDPFFQPFDLFIHILLPSFSMGSCPSGSVISFSLYMSLPVFPVR